MTIVFEFIPVKPAESVPGCKPQESSTVAAYIVNDIMRQAIFGSVSFKLIFRRPVLAKKISAGCRQDDHNVWNAEFHLPVAKRYTILKFSSIIP